MSMNRPIAGFSQELESTVGALCAHPSPRKLDRLDGKSLRFSLRKIMKSSRERHAREGLQGMRVGEAPLRCDWGKGRGR